MAFHPPWLKSLLEKEKQFQNEAYKCKRHLKPNTFFCQKCSTPICASCRTADQCDHDAIQIFRVSSNSAVRVDSMKGLVDGGGIQQFSSNSHNVFFLNCRPSTNHHQDSSPCCKQCRYRLLSPANRFCSIGCKVDGNESTLIPSQEQLSALESTLIPSPEQRITFESMLIPSPEQPIALESTLISSPEQPIAPKPTMTPSLEQAIAQTDTLPFPSDNRCPSSLRTWQRKQKYPIRSPLI